MSEREGSVEPEAKPAAKADAGGAAKAVNWGRIRTLLADAEQVRSEQGRAISPAEALEIVQAARAEGIPMEQLVEFVREHATEATLAVVTSAIQRG